MKICSRTKVAAAFAKGGPLIPSDPEAGYHACGGLMKFHAGFMAV